MGLATSPIPTSSLKLISASELQAWASAWRRIPASPTRCSRPSAVVRWNLVGSTTRLTRPSSGWVKPRPMSDGSLTIAISFHVYKGSESATYFFRMVSDPVKARIRIRIVYFYSGRTESVPVQLVSCIYGSKFVKPLKKLKNKKVPFSIVRCTLYDC